jgi:excisionase family DNA binding protein
MQYVTVAEAARRIGVTEKTVRLWIKSGRLSALHQARNTLVLSLPMVEAVAREHQHDIDIPGPGYPTNVCIPGNQLELAQQIQELRAEIRSVPGTGLFALGPGDMAYIEDRLDKIEAKVARIEKILFDIKTKMPMNAPVMLQEQQEQTAPDGVYPRS